MKTLLIAALLLASAGATPMAAASAVDVAACPNRPAHESARLYGVRARDYCEVRWQRLLSTRPTGGQTHDEVVDGCLRQCVTAHGAENGAPLGWILGGVWAAALAAGGGGQPTAPASP